MLKKLFSLGDDVPALTLDELSEAIDKTLLLYRNSKQADAHHTYLKLHLYELIEAQRARVENFSDMTHSDLQTVIDKTVALVEGLPITEAPRYYLRQHLYGLLNLQSRMAKAA